MRVLMPVGVSTPGGGKVDRGGECSRADACIGVSTPGGDNVGWVYSESFDAKSGTVSDSP